jgi:two-component system cell cycle sensor histidine kinase/response regulator CckA
MKCPMGNASLLGFSLPDEHEAQHYLEDIDTSSRRAADLCRQLIAYSGRGNFNVETIDVNALIAESKSLLEDSAGKNATLQYTLCPDIPHIDADALQIRQVIVNLVKNAAEPLGDGTGDITITTGEMDCDDAFLANAFVGEHAIPGQYIYIDISDTGLGMSPDTLTRAFEPFFTTKFAGRGRGLPAVQGIVHGHEGCIHMQSEARKGTCAFPNERIAGHQEHATRARQRRYASTRNGHGRRRRNNRARCSEADGRTIGIKGNHRRRRTRRP